VKKTDEGICVINVWETQSDFEAFVTNRLAPLLEEIGVPASSVDITLSEVHNYLAGSRYGRG